jgi:glycerophosphoryl diester phosphodiesterase
LLASWRQVARAARLVDSTSIARLSEGFDAWLRGLRGDGIDAINLHRREWSPARVTAVHAAGLHAFGWDAQTRTHIAGLLDAGVDGVYSDHVDLLMATIQSRGG